MREHLLGRDVILPDTTMRIWSWWPCGFALCKVKIVVRGEKAWKGEDG